MRSVVMGPTFFVQKSLLPHDAKYENACPGSARSMRERAKFGEFTSASARIALKSGLARD